MSDHPYNSEREGSSTCYFAEESISGVVPLSPEGGVSEWRKKERQRLIGIRRANGSSLRSQKTEQILEIARRLIGNVDSKMISLYWPIRGEPDLRALRSWIERKGGRCCLPVVATKAAPLEFRRWTPGKRLRKSTWSVAEPADGDRVEPDIILAPFVGIDGDGYRLGYGGGYFDRTLAALKKPATAIGIGFAEQAIRSIYPQSHDIPMDWIVTETEALEGQRQRFSGGLCAPAV